MSGIALPSGAPIDRARAGAALAGAGLDALVATSLEGVYYTTGFWPMIDELAVAAFAVVPTDPQRRPALVVPLGQLAVLVQAGVEGVDLYPYGAFVVERSAPATGDDDLERFCALLDACDSYPTPVEALREALRGAGVSSGTVALEERRLTATLLARVASALAPARVVPGDAVLDALRLRKSAFEVERLRAAAQVVEAAQRASMDAIAPGVNEAELVARFEETCRAHGAVPLGAHIGSGPRGALPLAATFPRTVCEGDVVKFDVICSLRGYKADTGRSAVVTRADDASRAAYEAVRAGAQAGIEAIRPGATVGDVFAAAVGAVRGCGFPDFDRHQVGHGIGLDIHEAPMLTRDDATVLEPGMVLCVEAPLYSTALGGWQVEDTVVVTQTGCDLLTTTERDVLRVV